MRGYTHRQPRMAFKEPTIQPTRRAFLKKGGLAAAAVPLATAPALVAAHADSFADILRQPDLVKVFAGETAGHALRLQAHTWTAESSVTVTVAPRAFANAHCDRLARWTASARAVALEHSGRPNAAGAGRCVGAQLRRPGLARADPGAAHAMVFPELGWPSPARLWRRHRRGLTRILAARSRRHLAVARCAQWAARASCWASARLWQPPSSPGAAEPTNSRLLRRMHSVAVFVHIHACCGSRFSAATTGTTPTGTTPRPVFCATRR